MSDPLRCSPAGLLLASAFGSGGAHAKPRHTTFAKMIESSPTVVVAKLADEPGVEKRTAPLEVLRVLRGGLKPGAHAVAFADTPDVNPKGGEFMAFLDE